MSDKSTTNDTTSTEADTTTDAQEAQVTNTNTDAQEAPETGSESKEMTVEDYKTALTKANQEAAKYRTQRNEYRSDAEKYREIQEAKKSELQKTQEALEAARVEASAAKVELARAQALAKYGIAEDNADLLGTDPDKFEVNAQRIGALQEEAAKRSAPPSKTRVENLKPGDSDPKNTPDMSYPSNWAITDPFAQMAAVLR